MTISVYYGLVPCKSVRSPIGRAWDNYMWSGYNRGAVPYDVRWAALMEWKMLV